MENDDKDDLTTLCALLNSGAFGALVAVQLARTELAQSFEVGIIQQTPVSEFSHDDRQQLAQLAKQSWSLKRQLDTRTENSHAFCLPALLQVTGDFLEAHATAWGRHTLAIQAGLNRLQAGIDDHGYGLYGISPEDRRRMEQGFGTGEAEDVDEADDDEGEDAEAAPMVASLLSWSLGSAFGRFDLRLATGARPVPPEPEPFDPLPVCSPGMLTGAGGIPLDSPPTSYLITFPADGILVDDPGHPRDLVQAVWAVLDLVFDEPSARWHEAAVLGLQDLRTWFARESFEQHIKRYSKSRRKAPIYWQLATPSGSYSVWLYVHRVTPDTLFRVLNDFVGPKLDHEQTKLARLMQESGSTPSAAQRRDIDQQETFVGELQALKAEVARVAPLWRPDLDDGVILNFAPLWRLVPQHRAWQNECR